MRYYFMSFSTEKYDKSTFFNSYVVTTHPFIVIENYNNNLSTGVKNHMLIFWKEIFGEELEIYEQLNKDKHV